MNEQQDSDERRKVLYVAQDEYFRRGPGSRGAIGMRPGWTGIFETYDEALEFLDAVSTIDEARHGADPGREYVIQELYLDPPEEIVRDILDDEKDVYSDIHKDFHRFVRSGTLIKIYQSGKPEEDEGEERAFEGKFKPGDLVWVPSRIEDPWTQCRTEQIGVVNFSLATLAAWKATRNLSENDEEVEDDAWSPYIVQYFCSNAGCSCHCGGITHWHCYNEELLRPFSGTVPSELKFLEVLSERLKEDLTLSGENNRALWECIDRDTFALNVETFDFKANQSDRSKPIRLRGLFSRGGEEVLEDDREEYSIPANVSRDSRTVYVVQQTWLRGINSGIRQSWNTGTWASVFTSEARALEFVKILQRTEELSVGTRLMVYEVELPERKVAPQALHKNRVRRCWAYAWAGELLWQWPAPNDCKSDWDRFDFRGKYRVGDVVLVVPQAHDAASESIWGDYGVVAAIPSTKEVWLASGRDPQEWDGRYRVHFIDWSGYLAQYKVPERCMLYMDSYRESQSFLRVWSRVLSGDSYLPEDLVERILARKVYLLKDKQFFPAGPPI